MRIHEIITELDPSRRSFLKTVGKTAAGVAGAAALGSLGTTTAKADSIHMPPKIRGLIKDLSNISYQAVSILEMFDSSPNAYMLSRILDILPKYHETRNALRDETSDFTRYMQYCIGDCKYEYTAIQKNHQRIEYLLNKTKPAALNLARELEKKK